MPAVVIAQSYGIMNAQNRSLARAPIEVWRTITAAIPGNLRCSARTRKWRTGGVYLCCPRAIKWATSAALNERVPVLPRNIKGFTISRILSAASFSRHLPLFLSERTKSKKSWTGLTRSRQKSSKSCTQTTELRHENNWDKLEVNVFLVWTTQCQFRFIDQCCVASRPEVLTQG